MDDKLKRAAVLLERCRKIMREEKIPVSEKINKLTVNGRVRSRFGKCTKTAMGYDIELSGYLMDADDTAIETVILHELLHTCPKCLNHGKLWKAYAEKLNRKYGYQIAATSSYSSIGLKDPGSRETVKYMITCTRCGAEFPRKRKCSLVENVDRYRCGKCGGKLEIH